MAEPLRVVIDPNVLVSAAIADGDPRRIVELVAAGGVRMVTCPRLHDELEGVLDRERFLRWRTREQLDRFVADIRVLAGFLENTDELNPFLVWREANGTIVHIQNSGGTPESILAFAENLTPLDDGRWEQFMESGQDRPPPPTRPADGVATTTTIVATLD